jgi:hypothetical protein
MRYKWLFLVDAGCIVWDEVTGVFGGHAPPRASAPQPPLRERRADTPAGFTFVPFGTGSLCELGPSAAALVRTIATHIAKREGGGLPPKGDAIARVQLQLRMTQRLGVACMRGQARQIVERVSGSVYHALAGARRATCTRACGAHTTSWSSVACFVPLRSLVRVLCFMPFLPWQMARPIGLREWILT